MPIAAGLIPLKSQITAALKMGRAAKEDLVAMLISTGVASIAPMGFFPAGPSPIPLVPSGVMAAKSQITAAFKMGRTANQSLVAQQIATAISIICPIVPPAGLMMLKTQIENALKMERMAKEDLVAQQIAQGIITYFQAAGVV